MSPPTSSRADPGAGSFFELYIGYWIPFIKPIVSLYNLCRAAFHKECEMIANFILSRT